MVKMKNSTYGRTGHRPLPETFDVDLINEMNTHLDEVVLPEHQDWSRIEQSIHDRFDVSIGHDEVSRHFAEFKKGIF